MPSPHSYYLIGKPLTEGEVPGTSMGSVIVVGWIQKFLKLGLQTIFLAPSRPILLLMDGHASHFSPLFVNRAIEENVIAFCLPPHSTHKAQPLDKGVFGPLKHSWREECHTYILNNPGRVVTRYSFSAVFERAWMKSMIPSNILGGFQTTGIYPTDYYAVIPKSPEKSPPSICKRTGLSIPLFTPVRQSLTPCHHSTYDDVSHMSTICGILPDESSSSAGMSIYTLAL